MTVSSLWVPYWVTYSVTTPAGATYERHIGLHRSCSNLQEPQCQVFPSEDLCQAGERYFCSMWRTVGFLASFVVILYLATLISFLVVMRGGKYKRETGWPFVTAMLAITSVFELVIISIVAYLYDNDDQFTIPGWKLDVSWIISTISAVLSGLGAAALASSAFLLKPEDDYDFLDDPVDP
jgi:hypothetical protein